MSPPAPTPGAVPDGRAVTVVVVTHDSADVLGGLLDTLACGLTGIADREVVVVDNASGDGSAALARRHPAVSRVIETGRNAGYAAAINTAMDATPPGRAILVLNPDIRLTPGVVATLYEGLECHPNAGVTVPRIVDEDGGLSLSLRREPSVLTAWAEAVLGGRLARRLGLGEVIATPGRYRNSGPVAWATGAVLLIAATARSRVGAWDESYFLYSEEVDFMRRIREAGLTTLYLPAATVTHIGGEHAGNPRLYSLLTINRIRYFRRHNGAARSALFRLGVACGEALRAARGRGYRAAFRAALRPERTLRLEWPGLAGR